MRWHLVPFLELPDDGFGAAHARLKYAIAYSDQNGCDFKHFQLACRKGRLHARSQADFAAEHLPQVSLREQFINGSELPSYTFIACFSRPTLSVA